MSNYISPFEITNEILDRVASIMEKIGKLGDISNLDKTPYLRKQKKINSIHSSLAIENNSLSLNQVTDVINGKVVIGKQKVIQEVKNAYKAYEMIKEGQCGSFSENLLESFTRCQFKMEKHFAENNLEN